MMDTTPIMVRSRPERVLDPNFDKQIGKGSLKRSTGDSPAELQEHIRRADSDGTGNIVIRHDGQRAAHTISIDSQETLARLEIGQSVKVGNAVGHIVFIDHDGSDDKK